MYVFSIGNVTQCNSSYIFLNENGKQDRLRATEDKLQAILRQAAENVVFYERMWKEVHEEYDWRYAEVSNRYHFITDEDVSEAFRESSSKGVDLSVQKDSNNEECIRQFNKVFGFHDAGIYALDCKQEAYTLKRQAEEALKHG